MFDNVHPMHIACQEKYAPGDVAFIPGYVHTVHMNKQRHYLREWREFCGKSQKRVAEEMEFLAQDPRYQHDKHVQNQGKTYTTLGRVEAGEVPYSQALLEMLAEIYKTDPGSLIMRNPLDSEALYSIWDNLTPEKQREAMQFLAFLKDKAA